MCTFFFIKILFFQLPKSKDKWNGELFSYKKSSHEISYIVFKKRIWTQLHNGKRTQHWILKFDSDWLISGPSIKGVQWCSMSSLLYLYHCPSLCSTVWVLCFFLFCLRRLLLISVCCRRRSRTFHRQTATTHFESHTIRNPPCLKKNKQTNNRQVL